MPLYVFQDIICDGRIHAMVISGHPSKEEIESAWRGILEEYNEAMGDSEGKLYFSLFKQILQRELDLKRIYNAVEVLKKCYVKELVQFLNEIFFTSIEMDPANVQDYYAKLKSFVARSKGIEMDMDMKRMQFDAMKQKRESEGSTPTREYFQTILLNLSDHARFEITDKITVYQFCQRVQRLNKYADSLKKHG